MKKILGFLILIFVLNACDDGDFNIESFDFSTSTPVSCNSGSTGFFIYQINNNEVLILQVSQDNFTNEITGDGPVTSLDINATNRVIYRLYNGTVNPASICSVIPPASPTVSEEWVALSGKIEITTVENKTVNNQNNSTIISGYTHSIVLRNVNFDTGNGNQQLFTELFYGDFVTPAAAPASFDTNIAFCDDADGNGIYSFLYKIPSTPNPTQALTFEIDSSLFENEVTQIGQPRRRYINNEVNGNIFKRIIYNGGVNNTFFCNPTTPPPAFPAAIETFTAANGVENESGIIEVTTTIVYVIPTDNQSGIRAYRHDIVLKKVRMVNQFGVFYDLGDVYEFGYFENDDL